MRIGAPAAALVLAAAVVFGAPTAEAGSDLFVRRFLLGRIEEGTGRFIATGGRGTDNAFRDNVILLVFSKPLDFDSLGGRTVKIGVPTGAGLLREAEGTIRQYAFVRRVSRDGCSSVRLYRNRAIFDPTSLGDVYRPTYGQGFEADKTYTVTVPGIDKGATKTVVGEDGEPNLITFTTTFRTTTAYLNGSEEPGPFPQDRVQYPE